MALGTILLAEDNDDDVLLMEVLHRRCKILNPLKVVFSGDQAIRYLQGVGSYADRALYPLPILFLLDVRMPYTSGLDVLRWMYARPKPAFPTIVLTGLHDLDTMHQAYQLGAHTFLKKPIEQRDFLPLVKGFNGIEIGPGD
jgi:CheY-like chemotaxis protein